METLLFNILDHVDSTNNYAMARVHEGLAKHGQAWFAHHQEKGKGQRGKVWESLPGENLIMSVALNPPAGFDLSRFHFHALVALTVARFLEEKTSLEVKIKWPNDLFFGDRKAGGILIENTIQGGEWKWSVIGIGININQAAFGVNIPNAVSLFNLTGGRFDPEKLARELHAALLFAVDHSPGPNEMDLLVAEYNKKLYRRSESVRFRHGNRVFKALVKEVDVFGRLITGDPLNSAYSHGELQWLQNT